MGFARIGGDLVKSLSHEFKGGAARVEEKNAAALAKAKSHEGGAPEAKGLSEDKAGVEGGDKHPTIPDPASGEVPHETHEESEARHARGMARLDRTPSEKAARLAGKGYQHAKVGLSSAYQGAKHAVLNPGETLSKSWQGTKNFGSSLKNEWNNMGKINQGMTLLMGGSMIYPLLSSGGGGDSSGDGSSDGSSDGSGDVGTIPEAYAGGDGSGTGNVNTY